MAEGSIEVEEHYVSRKLCALVALMLVVGACGGGAGDGGASGDDAASGDNGSGGSGDAGLVDEQAPGQATVSVDGKEYALEVSPAVDCNIAEDAITFAFWVGDNSITLGGGANLYEDGWLGSIDLTDYEPEDGDGPVSYFPDTDALDDGIAVDGDSMSYSGPMMKQPPNDGSNPPPVDVGNGTISVTCP